MSTPQQEPWWARAVFYQVYPRSFADSDGDGVGDLDGVTSRLDYLDRLGIEALWLSPIMVSPMADHGYDVADPRDVDPLFGGLAAFERLIAAAHERGIKITTDLVPNHTSSQHPWFQEALVAKLGQRRAGPLHLSRWSRTRRCRGAQQLAVGVRRAVVDPGDRAGR